MVTLIAALVFAETPEKTIEAFVAAYNAYDPARMARQVLGKGGGDFPFGPGVARLNTTIGKVSVEGDSASVDFETEFTGSGPGGRTTSVRETLSLKRIGADWRIVPARSLGGDHGSGAPTIAMLALVVSDPEIMRRS